MIAAPTTAAMLADFGAAVVKLERPGAGDPSRRYAAQRNGQGLYWKSLGRNKESVAFDLHSEEAQELFVRWLPQFDILIENFRPGTFERWNLAPARLLEAAPHLVMLRVTAFGQDGPYRDRAGFGTLAEAMTGIASVSGFEDKPPLLPAFPLADIMAGQLGAAAVCAAYARRLTCGAGEVIDLAIYEAVMRLMESQLTEYAANGTLHRRLGNRMEDTAPRGAYRCADGQQNALRNGLGASRERDVRAVGGEAMLADPRFGNNVERVANAEALDAAIEAFCEGRSRDEVIAIFNRAGCAVGPLETIDSVFENPQVIARGSLVTLPDPELGSVTIGNSIPRFEQAGAPALVPGPSAVGADTATVLARDLGLTGEDLERLVQQGIVGLATVPGVPAEPAQA
jgi:crotonobetainyl-CoA:carnitine CoA-transferase CaiB-like acyl-CoA transferase